MAAGSWLAAVKHFDVATLIYEDGWHPETTQRPVVTALREIVVSVLPIDL